MAATNTQLKTPQYTSSIVWTGNTGQGTASYHAYQRTWDIKTPGKPVVHCSNDPLLGGNPERANPEDLLLSAVAACHMLWYLHLASNEKISIWEYQDNPIGESELEPSGAGRFTKIQLQPKIMLADSTSSIQVADAIHHEIHQYCFIARSLSCPVVAQASYSFLT